MTMVATVAARGDARQPAERCCEVALARETRPERNFRDRTVGVREQRFRELDAPLEDVAIRRHAGALLERADESVEAHSEEIGQSLKRQRRFELLVDVPGHTAQIARRQGSDGVTTVAPRPAMTMEGTLDDQRR